MEENIVRTQEDVKARDRVRLGTIAGIPLFFNYSFLLWFLFIIFVEPVNLVLFISLLFVSITIHELAHALASRHLGLGTGTMTIWFLGGFFISFSEAWLPEMTAKQRLKYALMVLAGPLSNLVLYGVFLLLAYATTMDALYSAANYNLTLMAVNLIPVGYLDGGHIIRYLGSTFFEWRKITIVSGIFAIVLAVAMIVGGFMGKWLNMPSGLPGFLVGASVAAIRMARKPDVELLGQSRQAIDRELAITQLTSELNEAASFKSWIVKIGLIGMVLFSVGYLGRQYWSYKDLTGQIVYVDRVRADRRFHVFMTGGLGFPVIDAAGTPDFANRELAYVTNPGRIAFPCLSTEISESTSICIVDFQGNQVTEIPTDEKTIENLVWSPDAQKLAFSTVDNGILVLDVTSEKTEPTGFHGRVHDWSPDGDYLLATIANHGNSELIRINTRNGEAQNLTNNSWDDGTGSYTSDGQYIFFLSRNAGMYHLYRMDPDGSDLEKIKLKNEVHDGRIGLRISPDNSKILFSCGSFGEFLCVVGTDGAQEKFLTRADHAAWSPDSNYIALSDFRADALFVMSSDGAKSTKLKSLQLNIWDLEWLP